MFPRRRQLSFIIPQILPVVLSFKISLGVTEVLKYCPESILFEQISEAEDKVGSKRSTLAVRLEALLLLSNPDTERTIQPTEIVRRKPKQVAFPLLWKLQSGSFSVGKYFQLTIFGVNDRFTNGRKIQDIAQVTPRLMSLQSPRGIPCRYKLHTSTDPGSCLDIKVTKQRASSLLGFPASEVF